MMGFRGSKVLICCALALALAACAETQLVANSTKLVTTPSTPPRPPAYKIGKPYQLEGVWYYPKVDYSYDESGIASWYGPDFNGKPTASGEIYDENGLTAAHRTLPMPTVIQVTNLENGRSIKLRVNDRGPFARGRIIDVSRRAAQLLGFIDQGTARVRVQVIADESQALAAALSGGTMVPEGEPQPVAPAAAPTVPVTEANLSTLSANLPAPAAAPPTTTTASSAVVAGTASPPATAAAPTTQAAAMPPATTATVPAKPSSVGATATIPTPAPASTASAPSRTTTTVAAAAPTPPAGYEPNGRVTQYPVKPSSIFIQAGAFTKKQNAETLTAELRRIGPTTMTPVKVGGQQFYRVRLGPLTSVTEADRLLEELVRRGHPEARIVVD
jgi:peptidoglycan lytic transglycosylase